LKPAPPGQPLLPFAAGLPRRHAKALTVEAARAKRDEEEQAVQNAVQNKEQKRQQKELRDREKLEALQRKRDETAEKIPIDCKLLHRK
jgi:hypothetical protein